MCLACWVLAVRNMSIQEGVIYKSPVLKILASPLLNLHPTLTTFLPTTYKAPAHQMLNLVSSQKQNSPGCLCKEAPTKNDHCQAATFVILRSSGSVAREMTSLEIEASKNVSHVQGINSKNMAVLGGRIYKSKMRFVTYANLVLVKTIIKGGVSIAECCGSFANC